MQPSLKYLGYEILTTKFSRITMPLSHDKTDTIDIEIDTKIEYPQKEEKFFDIVLDLKLSSITDFNFEIEAVGHFEMEGEDIPDTIKESFLHINAPSIVYPYIRAFVASFTALAGQKMINLPAINFIRLHEERTK
jgi:preprotein translocase subunit SecB